MASYIVSLTRSPLEVKAATDPDLVAGTYRFQVPKRANYEVLLWEGDNPPGGPRGYFLDAGENIVVEIGSQDFHVWIFSEDQSVTAGELHVFTASV